jgi:hypothetical protein
MKGLSMDKETMKCKDCGQTFQSSTSLEKRVQSCPKCIKKSQDEMLRIMFGQSASRSKENSVKIQTITSADYSNELPNKVLDLNSLIEAIHEYFDPTYPHDSEYLRIRINLLRDFFGIGSDSINSNSQVIDTLLEGYGEIKSVQVLPFEGASEVPDSIDTEAHVHIAKQFKKELKQIRDNAYKIQRAYIAYVIQHSISSPKLKSKTITLSELISLGLPNADPGVDYDDF